MDNYWPSVNYWPDNNYQKYNIYSPNIVQVLSIKPLNVATQVIWIVHMCVDSDS